MNHRELLLKDELNTTVDAVLYLSIIDLTKGIKQGLILETEGQAQEIIQVVKAKVEKIQKVNIENQD